jgi:hypothetical protein
MTCHLARRVKPRIAVAWLVLAALAATSLAPSTAHAGPRADAEELFVRGRDAMRDKDYEKACELFKASLRAEDTMGTLLNLAICHEARNMVASAWVEYRAVEQRALQMNPPQLDRAELAREHAAQLRPRIPRVRIIVPSTPRLEGLVVSVDGARQETDMLEQGIPLDPGPHVLKAEAKGRMPKEQTFEAPPEGTTVSIDLPVLDVMAPLPPSPIASGNDAATVEAVAAARARRTAGFIVAGTGGVALVTSGVFGGLALSKSSEAKCGANCYDTALDSAKDAYRTSGAYADISTIAGIVGLVAAGVGVYLIVTGRPAPTQALGPAWLQPTPGGVTGAF